MIDHQALEFLIEKAQKSRNSAGRDLAEQRQIEEQLNAQISMLQNYRNEYRQRLQNAMANGVSLLTIRDYQRFLSSLDQAIEKAEIQVQLQRGKVENSQQHLSSQQRKLLSFDTLSERRKKSELDLLNRRDQKQTDEMITNKVARRTIGDSSGFNLQEDA